MLPSFTEVSHEEKKKKKKNKKATGEGFAEEEGLSLE